MPRKAHPRIKRPSGIETSANGKYHYWKCNVSGLSTFADEKRFKEISDKYGSETKLFKTYVLRPVQKYLDRGFDAAYIKKHIAANGGKLPSLDGAAKARKAKLKKSRKKRLGQFAVGEVTVQQTTASGSIEEVKQKIYAWTGNPDYFRSPPIALNVGEETRNSCLFPNRHLDDMCNGCQIYDQCASSIKYGVDDWKNPKKKFQAPKITPINAFADELGD